MTKEQISHQTLIEQIKTNADECVRCGLCLPHCPTYNLLQNEAESPRGRIALMKGIATQQLEITPTVTQYLDHCLMCRACEAVCPVNVPYGKLMDQTRRLLPMKPLPWWLSLLIKQKFWARLAKKLLWPYTKLVTKLGVGPPVTVAGTCSFGSLKELYTTKQDSRGDIALFTGCLGEMLDSTTLDSTVKLLNSIGYDVHVPPAQACCGALHLHEGQNTTALELMQHNLKAFAQRPYKAMISCASGCGATLQEYGQSTAPLPTPVFDVCHFVAEHQPDSMLFKPLAKTVLLHTPCTLMNVMHQQSAVIKLLKQIPELEIIPVNSQECCGAAGMYMLKHEEIATSLAQKIVIQCQNTRIDYFVTSNIGCALHIQRQLQQHNLDVVVLHPVSLLAQQLKAL